MPKTIDKDIVAKYVAEFESWNDKLQPYFKRFSDNYQAYTGYKKREKATLAKINDPMPFEFIERIVPRILSGTPKIKAMMQGGEWMEALQEFQPEQIISEAEETVSVSLEYLWENNEGSNISRNMMVKILPCGREFFITGNTCGEVSWKIEREVSQSGDGYAAKTIYDGPSYDNIPIDRIIFNPAKTLTTSDVYYVIKYTTYDELKKQEMRNEGGQIKGIYNNLEQLEDKEKKITNANTPAIKRNSDTGTSTITGPIEVLERWEGAKLCVIANRHTNIREDYDPMKLGTHPLVMGMDYEINAEPYGYGEIDPIYLLSRAKNTIINQRIDLINKALKPPLRIDPTDEAMKPESLANAYVLGGPVYAKSGTLEFLYGPQVPREAFMQTDEIQARAEATLDTSGYLGGTPQAYSDKTKGTMGGTQALIEQSQPRLSMRVKLFENQIIKPILSKWLKMWAKLMPEGDEQWIYAGRTNARWLKLTKDLLQGKINVGYADNTQEEFNPNWLIDVETGSMAITNQNEKASQLEKAMMMAREFGLNKDYDKMWEDYNRFIGVKAENYAIKQPVIPGQEGMIPGQPGMPQQQMAPPMGQMMPNQMMQ